MGSVMRLAAKQGPRLCVSKATLAISTVRLIVTFGLHLKAVHNKDDNYKDNDKDEVINIILNIKEQQSPHHSYNDKGTEKQYNWNHFQNDFFKMMNDTNIDSQSESILLFNELKNLKWQMSEGLEWTDDIVRWCGYRYRYNYRSWCEGGLSLNMKKNGELSYLHPSMCVGKSA